MILTHPFFSALLAVFGMVAGNAIQPVRVDVQTRNYDWPARLGPHDGRLR